MPNVTTDDTLVIDRDYTDIYSIKETALNTLGPKYFEDVPLSGLNVGELGFVLEQIGNVTEDGFNTASVLVKESFPNRAVIPESIFSHAAIFQMDATFTPCASCSFIMLLQTDEVLKLGTPLNSAKSRIQFFLDKNTTFEVEGIPFVLDYDIRIDAKRRVANNNTYEYIYSAQYVMDSENSISGVNDPYIKIRKTPNGYILLNFTAHQVERTEVTSNIINNTKVNFPVLEFEFENGLAGFDIFYKSPTSTTWVQLEKRIKFSLPVKTPFCYYKLKDEQTLEITFSSRDTYFQPDFNSEIKVVMYTTLGKDGNFETYNGSAIEVLLNSDTYEYNSSIAVVVKTVSDSSGGNTKMDLEALQALTVEAYSSATEISTEHDIQQYFYDYKYRYGDEILVIKRRDDVTERLFSAFLILKNDEFIFPTNTLHLNIPMDKFDYTDDSNIYTLEPGHVFVYADGSKTTATMVDDTMVYEEDKVTELMNNNNFVYTLPFMLNVSKSPNLVGIYQTVVNDTVALDYIDSNDLVFEQFITTKLNINRGLYEESEYELSLSMIPSYSTETYVSNLNTYDGNDVRVIAGFCSATGSEVGYIELFPSEINETDPSNITFSTKLKTTDHVTSSRLVGVTNAVRVDHLDSNLYVPIVDMKVNIYILFKDKTQSTITKFVNYFDDMNEYVLSNIYSTQDEGVTLIRPLNLMRSRVLFNNIGTQSEPIISANIQLLPMIRADMVSNEDEFNFFVDRLTREYNYLSDCLPRLRNNTNIDVKFYNTYGQSNNYLIGDSEELIDRVNISIKFIVHLVDGADEVEARQQLWRFIKDFIEKINSSGSNDLYISNLIREIENNFAFVHHLKFMGINDYDTSYQTISVRETDLNSLTKEERRNYVPEMLVIDSSNILLAINGM